MRVGGISTNGFLFFNFAQYLCLDTGTYNIGQDSEINRLLMVAFKSRQNHLQDLDCDAAKDYLENAKTTCGQFWLT